MQYDEFVAAVAERAQCEPHRAEAASKAVIQALAEQVGLDAFSPVASQLPGPLKETVPPLPSPRPMSLAEFYGRVTELGGVETVGDPERPARAVLATLGDAAGGENLTAVVEELPRDYGEILPEGQGPTGLDAFLGRVERFGELVSRDEAQELTQTTLLALAERISTGQARDLAASLPAPLRPYLEAPSEPAGDFDAEALVRRVMDARHLDAAGAERQIQAVFAALRERVPDTEISDTVEQLPPDLARMLR